MKKKNEKQLSVIVPCYEEAANVNALCKRLFTATRARGLEVELLLIDDYSGAQSEETKRLVADLKKQGYGIDVHTRMPTEGKGLSSAVVLGIDMARYPTVLVMDADLQHEPESVPDVAAPVLTGKADFSVGSRNVAGGGIGGDWALHRRILSKGATILALPLTPCTDPMSGFFTIDKEVYKRGRPYINPIGYKIGLELMVRCNIPANRQKDVPITFRDRELGESKLDMKQNIYYLQHLVILYWFKYPALVILIVILGMVGLYVALQILAFLLHRN